MRRIVMTAFVSLVCVSSGFAQFTRGIFNHLGVSVGASTEGISVGVAAPLTSFVEIEAGANFMPSFAINENVKMQASSFEEQGVSVPIPESNVKIKGDFSRTIFNVKANVYPFGGSTKFFIAGGFSFGGPKIVKVTGHSDELKDLVDAYPEFKSEILDIVGVELSDYNLKFNDNCDIDADIRCKSFRPYLGLGFGRLVPKNRIGFRFELGCQFMGKMRLYQNGEEVNVTKMLSDSGNDEISKFVSNWKYYPVLKLQVTGRIL